MTLAQLHAFIRRRNRSEFPSNLQIQIDADASGFGAAELGAPAKLGERLYRWTTPHGDLWENGNLGCGKMALWTDKALAFGDSRVGPPTAIISARDL